MRVRAFQHETNEIVFAVSWVMKIKTKKKKLPDYAAIADCSGVFILIFNLLSICSTLSFVVLLLKFFRIFFHATDPTDG